MIFLSFGMGLGMTEIVFFLATTAGLAVWVFRPQPNRWLFGFAICFLVGALFTPADPLSMLLVALPLSVSYGLGVLVGKRTRTNSQAERNLQ